MQLLCCEMCACADVNVMCVHVQVSGYEICACAGVGCKTSACAGVGCGICDVQKPTCQICVYADVRM